MFNGANNFVVNGGLFVSNVDSSPKANIDLVIAEVAPNAILNAGGRADEVRCYPSTREEVIGKVEKWMDDNGSSTSRMLWLSGPAGAGKSAILQTVAERCSEQGRQAANFFFFRGDATRNAAQPLVSTLVYQLLDFYPAFHQLLAEYLAKKPLICKASIEEQFKQLILFPIRTVQHSLSIQQPIILIVDGLDECDDEIKQEQILVALRALTVADHSPFLVLVSSRAEPHLIMSFNRIGGSAESIFLDDEYRPEDDIRRFVAAKFDEIKKDHHLALTLGADWPAKADVDAITYMSSGQFIYAATVMRFIQRSSDSPILSLRMILGVQPPAHHTPLAHLDAVYSYIFSKARDPPAIKLILRAYFIMESSFGGEEYFEDVLDAMGYEVIEVESLFADLASVVQVSGLPTRLIFYHASLNDYLKSQSRSGIYYVYGGETATELASICLRNCRDSYSLGVAFYILDFAKATPTLSESLLNASTQCYDQSPEDMIDWCSLISTIEKLYLKTDREIFKVMMRSWVRFAYRNSVTNTKVDKDKLSPAVFKYYKWYLITERVKFALRLIK